MRSIVGPMRHSTIGMVTYCIIHLSLVTINSTVMQMHRAEEEGR